MEDFDDLPAFLEHVSLVTDAQGLVVPAAFAELARFAVSAPAR